MLAAAFERWRSFVPSSAVVGHKTQTRLGGPSVHLCSGRAAERAVSDNASGPVPPHRPPLRPVGASLSSQISNKKPNKISIGPYHCNLISALPQKNISSLGRFSTSRARFRSFYLVARSF